MAQNLTNYGENAALNGTAMPATLYVKLHIGAPGEDATANPAGTTSRQSFTRTTASTGTCSNVAEILWSAVGTAETISHISIWDASSAGNPWWQGSLTTSRTVAVADNLRIAPSALTLTLD